ncbi:MAG: VOC family protein [Anaerolineaceae bacterium]|nr:VOC family protein [Anaerolineae bacterium]MCB9461494.1 VOC family protein [Anaerolineaceae bacterium]
MYTVTKYPQGHFSWADNSSKDAAAAKKFYLDVMGWDKEEVPMGGGEFYTMFKQDGQHVAGLGQMQQQMMDSGMPSVWNNYISVDDVDAMAEKAKSLGGTVIAGPFDVFESGRMATIQDPTGAFISLWQPKNHIGAGLVNTVGAMCWNELMTSDVEKAKTFYSDLLGWTYNKMDMGEAGDYWLIQNAGRPNGGIFPLMGEMAGMPPSWAAYFTVADIEATAEKVEAAGGKIHVPVSEATGTGRFILAEDPAGAICYFIQLYQAQPWDLN